MGTIIRPVHGQDLDRIFDIEQKSIEDPWSKKILLDSFGRYSVRVLEVDEQVIGFTIFQTVLDEAELFQIAVTPEKRGCGFGNRLMQDLLSELTKGNIRTCTLEVRRSNQTAQKLYERWNFRMIGMRKNYYRCVNGREDAFILQWNGNA